MNSLEKEKISINSGRRLDYIMKWFRKKDRGVPTSAIIQVIQASQPSNDSLQEQSSAMKVDKTTKTIWKAILFSAWAPSALLFFFLFWNGMNSHVFEMTGEEQGRLLSTYTLLLGFYITVRYVFFQLRESKNLSEYRSTKFWMIAEYCSFIGWIMLFVATIIGIIDYILKQPSVLLYAIELALFFTALVYALIDFLSASKAYMYI